MHGYVKITFISYTQLLSVIDLFLLLRILYCNLMKSTLKLRRKNASPGDMRIDFVMPI